MAKIKSRRFRMQIHILAVAAFATLSAVAAQAGTLQSGAWTPSTACTAPGDPPAISDKSPDAYNKTGKAVQAWQVGAQNFANCVQSEAKADQGAVVNDANAIVTKLSDELKALAASNDAAIAKLKAKK
jgi:hypothetical protein